MKMNVTPVYISSVLYIVYIVVRPLRNRLQPPASYSAHQKSEPFSIFMH